jgi:hypothetical protein
MRIQLELLHLVPVLCGGGASDAPQLAARVRCRRFTLQNFLVFQSSSSAHFLLILYLENNSDNSICISITSSLYNFQYLSFPG